MGLRFRKSFSLGPFRATLSKSGVSFSAGVKGARITKKANGNIATTVGIPGTGVYYTKEKSINKTQSNKIQKGEQLIMIGNDIIQYPEYWWDTITFTSPEEKILFILGYYAGVLSKYTEGEIAEVEVKELCIPFKIVDINNMSAKLGGERKYTSAHLSKMVEKGWFVRENRGIYKLSEEAIAPYIKKFKELEQQRIKEEEERTQREIAADAARKRFLENQAKEMAEKAEKLRLKNEKYKKYRKILAIIITCCLGGLGGLPSLICKQYKWFWITMLVGMICVLSMAEPMYVAWLIISGLIIPIISIKNIK